MQASHLGAAILALAAAALAQSPAVVSGTVSERAGVPRRNCLLQQGIPVPAMSDAEVQQLCLAGANGACVPANIEPEGRDENKKIRWLRVEVPVTLGAWGKASFRLKPAAPAPTPPPLRVAENSGVIRVNTPAYECEFRNPDRVKLTAGGRVLLDGKLNFQVYSSHRSMINAGAATTVLTAFRPAGFSVDERAPGRAVVSFRGRVPNQKRGSRVAGDVDPQRGFDCAARFFLTSLSTAVRFDWRLTNQAGIKAWLERYAFALPVAPGLQPAANDAGVHENLGSWVALQDGEARLALTAPFVEDLGAGAGMRMEKGVLLHGGIDMPIDGALTGAVPQVHRQFHNGMTRTFSGALVVGGAAEDARSELSPLDLVLPAAYYSRTGALPEKGDPVDAGEYAAAIALSAEWLLKAQWRGTLWWGEWWREFDLQRQEGAEETSNGNSSVAPLYHYYRTGDGRFLQCARRAASYTYDVQFSRSRSGPGPMLHCRRHLLDEQDWVHPRYQRITGAVIASHTLLAGRERRELIEALRSFTDKMMDGEGRMHTWDRAKDRIGIPYDVDTSNIMEALVECWRETGDPAFLEKARRMSRWTVSQWRARPHDSFWNWNLTQYVLRGLVAVAEATNDRSVLEAAAEISRFIILHPEYEGERNFVLYHAWQGAELNRHFHMDLPFDKLLPVFRATFLRMGPDGSFAEPTPDAWTPYPTVRVLFYDSKAMVAYAPVFLARMKVLRQQAR